MDVPAAKTAAFFDFDHTLLHGDAGVIFGWTLAEWSYSKGKDLPEHERRRYNAAVSANIARMIGTGAVYKTLHAAGLLKRSRLIELSYRFLEGLPANEMAARMERVWNEKLRERLYPEMGRIIEHHRKAGRHIVIVTTGLRDLVEHSKKALGEDVEIIGATMHAVDGIWQGRVEGPLYGVHKAAAVQEYAAKHDIDLSESYAYSDHYSDAAFLAVVGHPVAVNPSLRLQLLAKRKGWEIMRILPPTRAPAAKRPE